MELHSLPVSGGNGLQEERSLIVIQGLTVYNKVSIFNQCNKVKSICQLTTGRREKKELSHMTCNTSPRKKLVFFFDQVVCQSMEKNLFSNLVRTRSHRMLFAQQPYLF